MSDPTEAPAADADPTDSFPALKGDRWRITPRGDDTYALQSLTMVDGSSKDVLILQPGEVPELANLFALATDLLNGMPPSDSPPKLVFLDGYGPHARVLFTAFGQPPPSGASVSLPGVAVSVVRGVHWVYEKSGAARVEVRMGGPLGGSCAAREPRIAEHES